ncbi:MAG: hypothetical protein KDD62_00905 [Bdellovibrionales bacterium]|nr:hypothetical protein [Bdellovibrionales bacterium]
MSKTKEKSTRWWWALKWALLILFSPLLVPLWYLPKTIILIFRKGTRRLVYDEFLSYIISLPKRNSDGSVKYLRFVVYNNTVHVHYCIWGCILSGLVVSLFPAWNAFMAPLLVLLPIFCWIVVNYDFPFAKVWRPVLVTLLLLPLADYGLFKITEGLTTISFPWLQEHAAWTGVTTEMVGGYELTWMIQKGFDLFGFEVSAGTHFFAALVWALFFTGAVAHAWFYQRYELDRRDLWRKRLFKGAGRTPVYMRGIQIVVKDLLEVFPFGFASLIIEIKGRPRVFSNIAGLAFKGWLGGPMEELINTTSENAEKHHSDDKKSAHSEDEAELVKPFKEEMDELDGHDHDDDDQDDFDDTGIDLDGVAADLSDDFEDNE